VDTGTTIGRLGNSIKAYAPRIFVSSTSRDLGTYRQLVCHELWVGDYHPVVQEHFPSDPRRLSVFLEEQIDRCDAVICLIGPRFGEAPDPQGGPLRSYTQLEYDTARKLEKDVYVFLASPECALDDDTPEAEEMRRLQQAYIESVQRVDQSICKMFSSPEDLRANIVRLVPLLGKLKQGRNATQRPSPYPYFAGRQLELQQLTASATQSEQCVIVVLGPPGVGKTTLAWEWFAKHLPEAFSAAFWCPSDENQYTFDVFLDYALEYLLRGKYDKRSCPGIATRVQMLVQQLLDRPCLLVIDGMEKWLRAWMMRRESLPAAAPTDGRAEGQEGVDLFLSQIALISGGSHVVLTSRVLPSMLDTAPHSAIPVMEEVKEARLQGLDDEAAIALLRELGVRASPEEMLTVAKRFDKHPLSLTIMGKLAVRNYGGSMDRFRSDEWLIARDQKLTQLLEEMQQALPARQDSEHLLDLLARFIETPSYERFSTFLRWLVVASGRAGLVARPTLHLSDDALREALAILDDWSLIAWDRKTDLLYLSPLVREHFRRISSRSLQVDTALAEWYLAADVAPDAQSLQDVASRILGFKHALRAQNKGLGNKAILAPMSDCCSLCEWLAQWGHQSTGIDLLSSVVAQTEQPNRSLHLVSRGALYQDLGKLVPARDDLTKAIQWLDGNFWRRYRHREVLAGAYMNRGNANSRSANPAQAVSDLNRALQILSRPFRRHRQNHRILVADILTNRGAANRDLGHLSAAERDATEAMQVLLACLASGACPSPRLNERIARVMINRGNARANGRQYAAADDDYRQAIQRLTQEAGSTESKSSLLPLAHAMRGLLLSDTGRHEESRTEHDVAVTLLSELVSQGREDCQILLGLAYANRAETLIALSDLQGAGEDADAATRLYKQAAWEDSSELALWGAANETALWGLNHILKKIPSADPGESGLFRSWFALRLAMGPHVLALFVRELTGVIRLVHRHDAPFSAQAVVAMLKMLEKDLATGYASEWLMWELHDLLQFVAADKGRLGELGVPTERLAAVVRDLQARVR